MKPVGPSVRRTLAASLFSVVLALSSLASLSDIRDSEHAAIRLAELQAEIARHDDLYFRQSAPEISDAEYDSLKRELRALAERFPVAAAQVAPEADALGDDRSGRFPTHAHRVPMLGLEKSYTEADLRKFLARVERVAGAAEVAFVIEPKYDGLAISLIYERGSLVRAVTRGNGAEGDVVTDNLLTCAAVPRALAGAPDAPVPDFVEIRGEVYLELAEFKRINAKREAAGETPYAHPRNLAVGTLKSSDASVLGARRLAVVVYGWGAWEGNAPPASQRELLARLAAWGFAVPPAQIALGPKTVPQVIREFDVARLDFPGPLDGAVVKVDDVALRQRLGESRTAPQWAIAHKFEPQRVETLLKAITLQVGRTGLVTPVAELEPVSIGGTMVARASLHNRRMIERRDYRIGDAVWVEKAGEVIPQLVGVNLSRRPSEAVPFPFPENCPVCSVELDQPAGGVAVRCPNRACSAQVKRRIEYFVSEAALNIRGFGPALVNALVDRGELTEVDGIYRLQSAEIPARLREQIERSKRAELWRFIAGIGLPEIGQANAQKLADHFGSLEKLVEADVAELKNAGLTPAVAAGVVEEFQRGQIQRVIMNLIAAGARPTADEVYGILANKSFVFTGTLPTLSREEAMRRVRDAGGRVQSNVTRATSYLVAGEGGGKKLDDAKRLNVPVLSEAGFLALLAQP